MKLFEHDHFIKSYEDYKNNLFIIELNEDVEQWIQDNNLGDYDLDCEDMWVNSKVSYVFINFDNEEDETRFRLRWKEHYMYQTNTYNVVWDQKYITQDEVFKWLEENVGPKNLSWGGYGTVPGSVFRFYEEEAAIHFKLRWCGDNNETET